VVYIKYVEAVMAKNIKNGIKNKEEL